MSDPQVADSVIEGGKTVGSTGGLLAFAYVVFNFFKKKVEVDDERELKLLQEIKTDVAATRADVGTLSTEVKLLVQAHTATRADVDKLEAIVTALQLELATLRGKFDHLNEQLAK